MMTFRVLPLMRVFLRFEGCNCQLISVQFQQQRTFPTFYNSLSGESLWKSVTTKSNAAKSSPRGKRTSTTKKRNLNIGQIIGVGKRNMLWPGLNAPIIRGNELLRQKKLPEDPEREQKLLALRDQMGKIRRTKLSPLERGWSGHSWLGRSYGAPDPVEGYEVAEGMDSRVLELKRVFHMEGQYGRVGTLWALVFVGNSDGIGGFALGRGKDGPTAMRRARNRAAQKLMYIERFEEHTVVHDFFAEYANTKIWVYKKPEGYGLVCHRAIKAMCELLGIKNLFAKVEGTMNYFNITRAFMYGLLQQKTHQTLANETGLHVVEYRNECMNFPRLIASPEEEKPTPLHEIPDYKLYSMKGIVRNETPKPDRRSEAPGWDRYIKKITNLRNQLQVSLNLRAEHGKICSYYSEKYPECTPGFGYVKKKDKQKQEESKEINS